MLLAFVMAMVMNLGSYWFSDKIVLSMYGAKPVEEAQAPGLYRIVRTLATRAGIPMPSGGPAAFCIGHANREVNAAIAAQLERVACAYRYLFTTEVLEELSALILGKFGPDFGSHRLLLQRLGGRRVRVERWRCSSGTRAVRG